MALWGTLWGTGFPWGLSGSHDTCDRVQSRVWSWTSKAPGENTRKALCAWIAVQTGLFDGTVEAVLDSFDPATATGDRLDKIGAVVGLPRRGFSDARYRLFLQIQAQILLARADDETPRPGSGEGLLRIARLFVGTGAPAITFTLTPPFSFQMTVTGVTIGEAFQLADFLGRAVDAAVYGMITFTTASNSLYASRNVAVADSGLYASRNVAVAGAASYAYGIPVGIGP